MVSTEALASAASPFPFSSATATDGLLLPAVGVFASAESGSNVGTAGSGGAVDSTGSGAGGDAGPDADAAGNESAMVTMGTSGIFAGGGWGTTLARVAFS